MDGKDCILTITVFYNDKYFDYSSTELITIKELKEKSIQEFNITRMFHKKINFYILGKNNEKVYMLSEDDIILNADASNEDNPKLTLYLSTDNKKEIINSKNNNNNYSVIIIEKKEKSEEIEIFKKKIDELIKKMDDERNKNIKLAEENENLKKKVEENTKNIEKILQIIMKNNDNSNSNDISKNVQNVQNIQNAYGIKEENSVVEIGEKRPLNENKKTELKKKEDINRIQEYKDYSRKVTPNNTNIKKSENVRKKNSESLNNNDNCVSEVNERKKYDNCNCPAETKKNKDINNSICPSHKDGEANNKGDTPKKSESVNSEDNKPILNESEIKDSTNSINYSNIGAIDNNDSLKDSIETKKSIDCISNHNDNNNKIDIEAIRKEYGSDLDNIKDEDILKKIEENYGDVQRAIMDIILATTALLKKKNKNKKTNDN